VVKIVTKIKIASLQEVPLSSRKLVTVNGIEILIFNVNGQYYAINNKCPHEGSPLKTGMLEGNFIECPKHKARFDITDGCCVGKGRYTFIRFDVDNLETYEILIEGEDIYIEL
jgi:nitrite reductase/ring-hydroxylating ferredoxin subunit